MPPTTSHDQYPPFPSDITTAPLVSISLAKLEANDVVESAAFFKASQNLGFFYLNMSDSVLGDHLVSGAEKLLALQKAFFARPDAEKEEYAREKIDPFFGYRHALLSVTNNDGSTRRNETYNMRKDDFVGNSPTLPCHPLVTENWDLLRSYALHCREAIDLMITQLEKHLQLPNGTLASLHRISSRSGDHIRFNQAAIQPFSATAARQAEHTDFGTLTILFNWLGGLQIRLPPSLSSSSSNNEDDNWVYVKPIPGSAVVNLGDALVKFTAGILRSNVHRVVPPPAPQNKFTRNSLVYFSRPEDDVVLRRLKGGLIDKQPATTNGEAEEPEMTSKEWILRRSVGDLKGVYTHKGGLERRPQVVVGRV